MKSKWRIFFTGTLARMGLLALAIGLLPAVCHAVEYRLEDFVVLVSDQLILRGYADVLVGGGATAVPPQKSDLGAGNFAEIGGKGSCRVPVGAPALSISGITDDVAVIAPKIKLGNFAKVSHTICDGAACIDAVGTVGRKGPTLEEHDFCINSRNDTGSPCGLPDFPPFPSFTPGANDVIVPFNRTVNLAPGSYRDLIINAFGKVHFTFGADGVYNFRSIRATTASSYKLIFDDDNIQINVQDFVRLPEFGDFNPTGAEGITLYVAGIDDSYGGANKNQPGVYGPPAAFEYDGNGIFKACFVFVKNGTMNLRGASHPSFWATQWFGKSLQEISTLRITLKHPAEVCFEQGLSVTKHCVDGRKSLGIPITFSGTVTNTGNATIDNLILADDQAGAVIPSPTTLTPGQSATYTGSYVPSICGIHIVNTVTATGTVGGTTVSATGSDDNGFGCAFRCD